MKLEKTRKSRDRGLQTEDVTCKNFDTCFRYPSKQKTVRTLTQKEIRRRNQMDNYQIAPSNVRMLVERTVFEEA